MNVNGEFLTLWAGGAEILAGKCLLSSTPMPTRLVGQPCGHAGCPTLIVGCDKAQQAINAENHERRCHNH